MIKPSGLSGNFFHEFLVCCFVMGTVHKCNQAIKHLIKRGGALHDHEILQLTVAALKVIVCCVSKVYKLVSLIRHPNVNASVPVLIKVEIKFIITKLSNVSANILVLFSIFTVNNVMHCV